MPYLHNLVADDSRMLSLSSCEIVSGDQSCSHLYIPAVFFTLSPDKVDETEYGSLLSRSSLSGSLKATELVIRVAAVHIFVNTHVWSSLRTVDLVSSLARLL